MSRRVAGWLSAGAGVGADDAGCVVGAFGCALDMLARWDVTSKGALGGLDKEGRGQPVYLSSAGAGMWNARWSGRACGRVRTAAIVALTCCLALATQRPRGGESL